MQNCAIFAAVKKMTDIIHPITTELAQFEAYFEKTLRAETEPMDSIIRYVLDSQGKRLRPILVLLSAKLFGEVNDQTIKMKSVLVPLNLHFRIGFGRDAGIYLAAGPQFSFNVGDDEFKWNADGVENTFQLKKSSLSANIGAGFYIAGCWEVGVTSNIALGKTGDATFNSVRDGIKEDDGKSRTWQLSASYYF